MFKFICQTDGCENNINPVFFEDCTEEIWCPLCKTFSTAIEES